MATANQTKTNRTRSERRRVAALVREVARLPPDERLERIAALIADQPREEIARNETIWAEAAQGQTVAPQTRRELWQYIRDEMGYSIPYVAVCEGHTAPFDLVADCFFEQGLADKLAIGSRGSSKTLSMAVVHALNAKFKARHQGATVASVLSQSKRCVAADTLIDCPRDMRRYPNGVPISQLQPGRPIWTFNHEHRRFELQRVQRVWQTMPDAPILKVTLDTGEVVRATPDHRVLRRDGSWAELRDLRPGDSLMPFYRDFEPLVRIHPDEYMGGGNKREFDLLRQFLFGDNVQRRSQQRGGADPLTHHEDGWRSDLEPDNLTQMTRSEHRAHHNRLAADSGQSQPTNRVWNDPEHGQERREKAAAARRAWWAALTPEERLEQSRKMSEGKRRSRDPANHVVVSVEPGGHEPVWDMTVEGNHNFVSSGVVLHNCWGYFGRITSRWRNLLTRPPAMGHTEFRNGSEVEIITGTMQGVNSPHPNLAHLDEIELWDAEVYEEALNMTQSTNGHRALNVRTSSWKKVSGMVTRFVDEVRAARRNGTEPPIDIHIWCVFETTQPCPSDCAACPYRNIVKGTWDDGSPRSFEDVCKGWTGAASRAARPDAVGKLKRSRGFQAIEDAIRRFRTLGKRMWEAQQESRRPTAEGLIYAAFDEQRHTLEGWEPSEQVEDASGEGWVEAFFGDIDIAVDYGGTNPTAIQLWQQLSVGVDLNGKHIPEGSAVLFDEFYETGVSSTMSAVWVNKRIEWWEQRYPGFRDHVKLPAVRDPAAKDAALNWHTLSQHARNASPAEAVYYQSIPTTYRGGQDREDGIALVQERIEADLVYVDRVRCENFLNEIGGYDQDAFRKKEDDHHMDAMRYRMVYRHAKERVHRDPAHTGAAPRARAAVAGKSGREWHPGAMQEYEPYRGSSPAPSSEPAKAIPDAPRVAAGPPRRRATGL